MPHTGDYGQKGPGVMIALGALKKRRDNSEGEEEMPMEKEMGEKPMMMERVDALEARIEALEAKLGGAEREE